ncbi:DctP family TRAP transporter solute-binding subunit [Candidatus Poribacteria bacterium]
MTRRSVVLAGVILLLVVIFGTMVMKGRKNATQQKSKVIKFAHVGPEEDARQVSALKFEQIVESQTNGEIQVEVYYGGQLGGDRDAIEGTQLGTIQMTVAGAGIFAMFEPTMGITALPFLFDDFEQAWAFNDSELNAEPGKLLLKSGIRILAYWDNGFRCLTNSVRPVESPEDLIGMKIRTPENPVILETMRAFGANPSPLPWPELYMALQQKAFDGQENPIPTIYVNKLYEVQKYISMTNHVYEPMPVVISETLWKTLTGEQQTIVRNAALECQNHNRNLVKEQTEEMLAKLKDKGMTVSYPNLQAFREATVDVRQQFSDKLGSELIEAAYSFRQ